ncbi:hypothetical protein [Mycolicibacterium vinylchloridicum]|uniref:hypothetical protein n=1 Tax=Mycolicibacterium vinylchloridicum TaxID=2736928 RepID=UPI00389969A6
MPLATPARRAISATEASTPRSANTSSAAANSEGAVTEPAALVELALDGLEAGDIEIADAIGLRAKAALAGPPQAFTF